MQEKHETIKTRIWFEEPESDNPYAASACYCSGYDVYGELLGNISWIQYLYLLFKLELPTPQQAKLLENLAVALANPGIRDHSVRAAMNAGVGGSTRASALMAALAVGAGNLGGGREVHQCLILWREAGIDMSAWQRAVTGFDYRDRRDVWLAMEHFPGFDPNGADCPKPVRQVLDQLAHDSPGQGLGWLAGNRMKLEAELGYPLAMSGIAAAALHDLSFEPEQGEMLYLLLRLPGAAVHALEQEHSGWRQYPFFGNAVKPMSDEDYQTWLKSFGETT